MDRLIASFLGTGLVLGRVRGSDSGSGTIAASVALIAAVGIEQLWGWMGVVAVGLLLTVAGIWAVSRLVGETGDAGWIVVDEAAGMFLAVIGLTAWPALVTAFVVFRLADIVKSGFPGVRAGERLPGACGVMADDLVAALYGLAAGHAVQALM
jgi:phosphatidylglycerophosphatase A